MTDRPATAARLTPAGRGAVATIAFAGDCEQLDAASPPLFQAANGRPLAAQPLGRIVFGHWGTDPAEETVLCRIDGQTIEIHCHGGESAVQRILHNLRDIGCDIVPAAQWDRQQQGELAADYSAALGRAPTLRTARILLQQQTGLLDRRIDELLAGDWSAPARREDCRRQLRDITRYWQFGRHLTEPWKVVVMGKPNVGKSSLINALVGFSRSIVFDQPGTTRDIVTSETAFDGWPIRLLDTAGLREGTEQLEQAGIERSRSLLSRADCLILVWDRSAPLETADEELHQQFPHALLVANKADLPAAWETKQFAHCREVSAVQLLGIDELAGDIVSRLIPEVPTTESAFPINERQHDALQQALLAIEAADRDAFERALNECLGRRS